MSERGKTVRQFKAQSWYDIKGRGRVAGVINDEEFAKDSNHLIGELVSIDDEVYRVRGVEAYALATIRRGAPIGLLVEPVPMDHASDAVRS